MTINVTEILTTKVRAVIYALSLLSLLFLETYSTTI